MWLRLGTRRAALNWLRRHGVQAIATGAGYRVPAEAVMQAGAPRPLPGARVMPRPHVPRPGGLLRQVQGRMRDGASA